MSKRVKILLVILWLCILSLSYSNGQEKVKETAENTGKETKEIETKKKEIKEIKDDIQLLDLNIDKILTDTTKAICRNTHKMVEWPTKEHIEKHYAKKDRTKDLPSFYAKGGYLSDEKAKELELTPLSLAPEIALKEAKDWIQGTDWSKASMKKEWLPEDLDKRLLPIMDEAPAKSKVICRFEVEGNKIQISQIRWFVWVVITPASTLIKKDTTPSQLIDLVFKTFFAEGERMSRLPKEELPGNTKKITAFKVGPYDFVKEKVKPCAQDNWWWWWKIAYTDGKSVAIFMMKGWEDMQHGPSTDEPWF